MCVIVKSKASAMVYAIENSRTGVGRIDCEQADKIYRMFADNINLDETDAAKIDDFSAAATDLLDTMKQRLAQSQDSKSETDAAPNIADPEECAPKAE